MQLLKMLKLLDGFSFRFDTVDGVLILTVRIKGHILRIYDVDKVRFTLDDNDIK